MKLERDLQGESGGGHCLSMNAYSNPTFNISSTSIDIDKPKEFKGSNDFICMPIIIFVFYKLI